MRTSILTVFGSHQHVTPEPLSNETSFPHHAELSDLIPQIFIQNVTMQKPAKFDLYIPQIVH